MRRFKLNIGLKMALLCSFGLFVILSVLFHFSFNTIEDNLLDIIKQGNNQDIYKTESIKRALFNNRLLFVFSTITSIVLSVGVVMFIFNRLAKRPLNSIIKAIETVEGGDVKAHVPVHGSDEFAVLSRKFNHMIDTISAMQNKIIEEYINEKILVVDSISVGVVVVDYDRKVLFANQAALRLFNKSFEEFVNVEFPYAITPGVIKEYQIRSPAGMPVVIEMRSQSIEWQKTPAYLVCMIDVTRLKSAERQLREAKEKAEAATVAKSLFLANMSHEIRTPMNAIMGMTDIVLSTDLNEDQQSYIHTIRTAAENLLKIINDILDLSKIESGKMVLECTPFNLEAIVQETMSIFWNQANKKGLNFYKEIEHDVPMNLRGDPLRLKQVIFNLLSNAIKFTEKGEVVLTIKKVREQSGGRYHISQADRDSNKVMLLFCVRDTGIGIPYALQERVFDSFTQADNTITRRYGGTGLGLTICKEIVRLMKGAIWVESEYGKGSSFYFTALFGMEDRPCVGTEPSQGETLKAKALSWPDKIRILVAEDDRLNQKVMSMMLNKYGLDYVIVENGRQVMEELERGHYDLILMDVQMPEMDGLEATRLIRTSSSGAFDPKIPIVAVTAFAMKEDVERCISAGMDEYISKPIKADRLMEVINRVLKKGA